MKPAPPLAGRSPSYAIRQLYDFQSGARTGLLSPLMTAATVERQQQLGDRHLVLRLVRAVDQVHAERSVAEAGLQAVDGLLTGLHEPHASHLDLLRTSYPDWIFDSGYLSG